MATAASKSKPSKGKPNPQPPTRKPVADTPTVYSVAEDPTMRHPLQGKRVMCTLTGDPQSLHKKTKVLRGVLSGGNHTVTFIEGVAYWTSNIVDLKEKK